LHAGLKCSLLPIQPKRCPPARSYPQPTGRSADFTNANLILSELHERTTSGVTSELNQVLQLHEGLPEHLFATTAAINHEVLGSMKLNGGMVTAQVRSTMLPHTRLRAGACQGDTALALKRND
jgi:hypothetical protein